MFCLCLAVTDMQRSIADASGDVSVDPFDVQEVLDDQFAVEPDAVVQRGEAHQVDPLKRKYNVTAPTVDVIKLFWRKSRKSRFVLNETTSRGHFKSY